MLVGAFYHPPDKTDADYINKVKEEISTGAFNPRCYRFL
jgi:hypothetical protein